MAAMVNVVALLLVLGVTFSEAAKSSSSFDDNFKILWAEDHFKTSPDGQIWYLTLDKKTGAVMHIHILWVLFASSISVAWTLEAYQFIRF